MRPEMMRQRILLAVGSTMLALLFSEGLARLAVAWRWPTWKIYETTHHTHTRGNLTWHPELGYVLTPGFRDSRWITITHNQLGARGSSVPSRKGPNAIRIALLGGSTVYGIWVSDDQTSAANLERLLQETVADHSVEVLNFGTPGWTSAETARNLELRVLPLEPDIVVIIEGRNEVFPQLFNNYRDDYSHYRIHNYSFRYTNYRQKIAFRLSHLALALGVKKGWFGYSGWAENPAYGSIVLENRPTTEELLRNSQDHRRSHAFQENLQRMVRIAEERGVETVLSTIPFLQEKWGSGVLPARVDRARITPVIGDWVAKNQQITRDVADQAGISLVDAARFLSRPDLLRDDCHFNIEGEQRFAELMATAIRPLIPGLIEKKRAGEALEAEASTVQ